MSRQPGRKLSPGVVRSIREAAARGVSDTAIAALFEVTRATVARYVADVERPSSGAWEPACMEPDELEGWRAGVNAGCRDCTIDYAQAMRAEGRCNGVPGALLIGAVVDEDPAG